MKNIEVYNARIHNLKNVNVKIPKNKLIAVTGVSGSGKSSFVFDILHKEGQRLYFEALGIYSDASDYDTFDIVEGLSPTIAVQQRTVGNVNPRSVIGTVTRIINLLAIIYAYEGETIEYSKTDRVKRVLSPGTFMFNSPLGGCPECGGRGVIKEVMIERILPPEDASIEEWHDFAYNYPSSKKEEKEYIVRRLSDFAELYNCTKDTPFSKLSDEAKNVFLNYQPKRIRNKKQLIFYGVKAVLRERVRKSKKNFQDIQTIQVCPRCHGYRLESGAFSVLLDGKHMGELCKMNISTLSGFLDNYEAKSAFTQKVLNEIQKKLKCLEMVGMSYLNLYREIPTLSGGEMQRLHIMSHLSSKFDSVIYIFDEPTAGLHEIEKGKIIESFKMLKDKGNTVIIVEHDESVIKQADYIVDFGPKAGRFGGNLVFQGEVKEFEKCTDSITRKYLEQKTVPIKGYEVKSIEEGPKLVIRNVNTNNLKNISVDIPLNQIVGICGASGSGKSSLVMDTLLPQLEKVFKSRKNIMNASRGSSKDEDEDSFYLENSAELSGEQYLNNCFEVTQKLPGRHENSCVVTFLGIWDNIRKLFAAEKSAINRGFDAGYFSFNAAGCCSICNGSGYLKRWVGNLAYGEECPSCNGKRFKKEVLEVSYKGKNISDILNMSVSDALLFFENTNKIKLMLQTIEEMGMGYILLGQRLTTLSGGEAQRLKLAKELGVKSTGSCLYILDEPTVGLSYYDTEKLLGIMNRLIMNGNSVVVIEHDPYVLSYCDYLIEMGPRGGDKGGKVIAKGTPEQIRKNEASYIGKYL